MKYFLIICVLLLCAAKVSLTVTPNTEPDLKNYNYYLNDDVVGQSVYETFVYIIDTPGTYTLGVCAVDTSLNTSELATTSYVYEVDAPSTVRIERAKVEDGVYLDVTVYEGRQ